MKTWKLLLAALALLGTLAAPAVAEDDYEERRMSDAALELAVKAELLQEIGWDMMSVDVEAYGSRIVLMGDVETKANEELAKEVALSVDGVERVTNLLKVEGEEKDKPKTPVADRVAGAVGQAEREVGDAVLESRIKTKLIKQVGFTAFSVEVEATDGIVSLRGEVEDKERRRLIKKIAKDTEGVEEIIDLLKIED
ncbi:MAG: BON domain-containing protein [Acidobacteriota bacterium]